MSVYAIENDVRLYALSFVDLPSPAVQTALTIMTTSTGDIDKQGFYQHAPDADALNALYDNDRHPAPGRCRCRYDSGYGLRPSHRG